MARIRTIKPEFFKHEALFDAEKETGLPLRIAFAGIWCQADREGRFKWRPRTLKTEVLPHDEIDFSRVLHALTTRGFIVAYACQGEVFGYIPSWRRHQVINNRETASEIPDPSSKHCEIHILTDASITRESRDSDACLTEIQSCKAEGKGREGKGREGEESTPPVEPQAASTAPLPGIELKPNGKHPLETRSTDVEEIFEHWKTTRNHPTAKLGDSASKRYRAICNRFADGYTVAQLKRAIDGVQNSPHHRGENDRSTVYDDIELICRDPKHVDMFLKFAEQNSSVNGLSAAGRRTYENAMSWEPPEMRAAKTFTGNST